MNLFEYTYDIVRQIPEGKVSSYGAVAQALGDILASRAVGWMMNQNPDPDSMPCFKIVHSDGRLGGFGLGTSEKIRRLNDDHIDVIDDKIVNFSDVFFDDFTTTYPLKKLQDEQQKISQKISLNDNVEKITTIAGVDVAYPEHAFDDACAAYVLQDFETLEVLEETTVFSKTFFPYIPSYLAYRELPIIKHLFSKVRQYPSVFLFDGYGIHHPRGCGLASHLGVEFDVSSIGVAKSPYINLKSEAETLRLHQSKTAHTPVYVSPGHKISMQTSQQIVQKVSKYKNPDPLLRAHKLAKKTLHEQR